MFFILQSFKGEKDEEEKRQKGKSVYIYTTGSSDILGLILRSLRFVSVSLCLSLEVLGQYFQVWFSHIQMCAQSLGFSSEHLFQPPTPDGNPPVTTVNLIY